MGTWSRDYFSRNSWHIFSGQIMQGEVGGEMMKKKKEAKDLLKALESPPLKISNLRPGKMHIITPKSLWLRFDLFPWWLRG